MPNVTYAGQSLKGEISHDLVALASPSAGRWSAF